MTPAIEDIPLIVQLYSDLSLRAIADKFDTTPRTISRILKENKVVVKKKACTKTLLRCLLALSSTPSATLLALLIAHLTT